MCLTHRYYDPGAGKFLNRDPIGYAGGVNLYGFCEGNPVNDCDPNGTDSATLGEWIDHHLLHGTISKWAWSQGMADSGHASQFQVMQHAANAMDAVGDIIVLVAVPESEAISPAILAEEKAGTVTVYRGEHSLNRRLNVGPSGGVTISGNKMLFLNFSNGQRSEEFYQRRVSQGMKDIKLYSFQVPQSYVGSLSDRAVLEHEAHLFPNSPLRVDAQHQGQFGLRPNHIKELKSVMVPGSGRVIR